jgi:hypothetical protein
VSSVGSFFSYIKNERSQEPKARKVSCTAVHGTADTAITTAITTTTTTNTTTTTTIHPHNDNYINNKTTT